MLMSPVLFPGLGREFLDVGKFSELFPLSGLGGVMVVKKSTTVITSAPRKTGIIIAPVHKKKHCHKKLKPRHVHKIKSGDVIRKPKSLVKAKDTLALLSNEHEPKMERMIIPTIAASILGALGTTNVDAAPKNQQVVEAPAKLSNVVLYTVRKGDTVGHILKRFGMSLADFKRLNPQITDINKIKAGEKVKVYPKSKSKEVKKTEVKKYKPSEYKVPELAVRAIKTWESAGAKNKEGLCVPYYDKAGKVWTIGFGTTYYPDGRMVGPNDKPITEEEAEKYLRIYLGDILKILKKKSKTELTEGQLSAILSFGYNAGASRVSTLCNRYLSKNKPKEAIAYMKQFVNANGKKEKGLVRRREREEILWNTGNIVKL